ncbi:hypothetical protein ZIOFF_033002 [Zingiber officinale]|uniref:Cw7 protein n=1 Tax=Zingiber officinale TaxID=94328 RepID=A0A8J5LBY9_ZINOF|nr:hypothetical protein ZIOFF_033002 [Zingiber officinale]
MLQDGAEKPIWISSRFSDDEAPARRELLSMVKKHSNLLGESVHDLLDASDVEMDDEFWHEVLDFYFIRGRVSKGRQEDDLLFFVRSTSMNGYGSGDAKEDNSPFFVRRWGPELERVIGESSACVDWRRSFYLNLIAHTSFRVTVAICNKQDLEKHQSGQETSLSSIYKVVKTVYASPSRVNFHLDHRKAVETLPAYPNICFSVDDFDDTFDAVVQLLVLSERDHCYCVLLNAHNGAAFPSDNDLTDVPEFNSSRLVDVDKDSEQDKPSQLTLFSGFVSYQMVREAYDAGRSRFGSLLSMGHGQPNTDRIYMRGPGGRGEVEVAVSGIADQSNQHSELLSTSQLSSKGSGISLATILHRAASAASVLAKQAYAASSPNNQADLELLPLKCCLMSISLPWEHIAHDLLFKVRSSSIQNIIANLYQTLLEAENVRLAGDFEARQVERSMAAEIW